jgi:hypothetical protein
MAEARDIFTFKRLVAMSFNYEVCSPQLYSAMIFVHSRPHPPAGKVEQTKNFQQDAIYRMFLSALI